MSVSCTFHRSRAAHFHCYECGSVLCEQCVSVRDSPGYSGSTTEYFCPGCNIPAEMMSLGNIIEPFWNRLTSVFLFPFQLTPLILTVLLAGLGALLPTNIFVNIFIWVVMMKYAYASLLNTAAGSLRAPAVTWDLINQDVFQVFKQFVLFAIIGFFLSQIFQHTGVIAGYVFLIIVVLAFPAIIMLLVSTNSLFHALNPFIFIQMIIRIGWPYLLMYLFLSFLFAGPAVLFSFLPMHALPFGLMVFFTLFLQQSYALIGYHLMGYVLLQYHKEIGYTVDYDFFMQNRGKRVKREKQTPEGELKKCLAVLIKTGNYKEAIEQVKPFVRRDDPDMEISETFLQLLRMAGEKDKAARYCIRHFELLTSNNKKQKATALFSEVKSLSAGPPKAESSFKVAQWYREQKNFKKAIETYVYFLHQYKQHALQPQVYYELAKLLHEQAKNSSKSKEILKAMIRSYPGHPLTPQAERYLALLN